MHKRVASASLKHCRQEGPYILAPSKIEQTEYNHWISLYKDVCASWDGA